MWTRTLLGPRRPTESQYDIGVWESVLKKARSTATSTRAW